jgi:hypothetical protein
MELSFVFMFFGAVAGLAMYLVAADFRAVAKNVSHYDWRLLTVIFLATSVAFWCLPLVVIKDTFSSAVVILRNVHATSLRPAPYRPDSSYFDYFRGLLEGFALFSFIASVIFAWLIQCLVIMFRQKRRQT